MKKLRMIVASVIVLAIVGGAYAFKTKVGAFCLKSGTVAGYCTTYKSGFKITTTGILNDYMLWDTWDGDPVACTHDALGHCTSHIKVAIDGIKN